MLTSDSLGAAELFPVYPCMEPNVAFWESIYSRYTTKQAVLHDSVHLNVVYQVLDLADPSLPGARQLNNAKMERAKERIADILERLADGESPRTSREQEIARLVADPTPTGYRLARERLRAQIGQADRFREGVIRSGRYLPYIRRVFAESGLPLELAWLPHVESSFNPKAGSKVGAYGLWQFTKGTGKDYMVINSLVDERFDPYTSSWAAARFLKENYEVLGSWPLALTAYNYGRAGMVRAKNALGGYEAIFQGYSEGYFKFASRNFYSEFVAAMRSAQRLEGQIAMEDPVFTKGYRLDRETRLAELCRRHNMSQAGFLKLNPGLQKPVRAGQRHVPAGYLVRTPAPAPADVAQYMRGPQPVAAKPARRFSFWPFGSKGEDKPAPETAAAAAEQQEDEAWAKLPRWKRRFIRPRKSGQTAQTAQTAQATRTTQAVPNSRLAAQTPALPQEEQTKPKRRRRASATPITPSASYIRYIVTEGDTVAGIAQRFGITRERLYIINSKGPNNPIRVGDRLLIPEQP